MQKCMVFGVVAFFLVGSVNVWTAQDPEQPGQASPAALQEVIAVQDKVDELIADFRQEDEEAEERWAESRIKPLAEFEERLKAEGKNDQEIAAALSVFFEEEEKEKVALLKQNKEKQRKKIREYLVANAPHVIAESPIIQEILKIG